MDLKQQIEWLKAEFHLTDCLQYKLETRDKLNKLGVHVEMVEINETIASRFMNYLLGK
jgi:hypothetical protein